MYQFLLFNFEFYTILWKNVLFTLSHVFFRKYNGIISPPFAQVLSFSFALFRIFVHYPARFPYSFLARNFTVPIYSTHLSFFYLSSHPFSNQNVCPFVRIGSPAPSPASECVPPTLEPKGVGNTRLRVRGAGEANSNDWRESLALCLLCDFATLFCKFVRHCQPFLTGISLTSPKLNSLNFPPVFKHVFFFCHALLQVPSPLLFRKIVVIVLTACPQLVMLGQVKPGEEVETQGRISALLASGLASWRGSENQEPSSPLDQVGQGPVLRIRDVYPGSRILIFTHPGSRIPGLGSRIQK